MCCRKCVNQSFEEGCVSLLCRSCCKGSQSFTRCSTVHNRLCLGQGCLDYRDQGCLSHSCEECCAVVWCGKHGNPNICRSCMDADASSGCAYLNCNTCCKRRMEACNRCAVHREFCKNCQNKRSRNCESISCGRCCETSGVWIMAIRNCVEVVLLLTVMTVVSFVHLVVL